MFGLGLQKNPPLNHFCADLSASSSLPGGFLLRVNPVYLLSFSLLTYKDLITADLGVSFAFIAL